MKRLMETKKKPTRAVYAGGEAGDSARSGNGEARRSKIVTEAAADAQMLHSGNDKLDLLKAFRIGKAVVADIALDPVERAVINRIHQLIDVHSDEGREFHADILLGKDLAEYLQK